MGIKVFFALVVISRLTLGQGRYENKYFQLLIYSLEFPKNKKRKKDVWAGHKAGYTVEIVTTKPTV